MRTQAIGAGFEGLEERLLLAGNVVSALAAGVLSLTGDVLANQIQVTVASNGQMTATGLSGTTIDGVASKNFGVVNTLTILGNAGDDSISLNATAATIANDVSIDGGLGNNTISVTGRFGADLILTGDAGIDTITVNKATVAVDLNLDAGDGNNKVTVSNSTITQQAVIVTGTGNDTVKISGSSFYRDLTQSDTGGNNLLNISNSSTRNDLLMALGSGNDTLLMSGVTAGARVGSTANGLIDIDFGDGKNVLTMSNSKALGSGFADGLVLTGGTGNDSFAIMNSQSSNGIVIDAGDGANRIEMIRVQSSGSPGFFFGLGGFVILTGLGEDNVKLDQVNVSDFANIDLGMGNDIFQLTNSRIDLLLAVMGLGNDTAYLSNNFFSIGAIVYGDTPIANPDIDSLTLGANSPNNATVFRGFESTRFGRF